MNVHNNEIVSDRLQPLVHKKQCIINRVNVLKNEYIRGWNGLRRFVERVKWVLCLPNRFRNTNKMTNGLIEKIRASASMSHVMQVFDSYNSLGNFSFVKIVCGILKKEQKEIISFDSSAHQNQMIDSPFHDSQSETVSTRDGNNKAADFSESHNAGDEINNGQNSVNLTILPDLVEKEEKSNSALIEELPFDEKSGLIDSVTHQDRIIDNPLYDSPSETVLKDGTRCKGEIVNGALCDKKGEIFYPDGGHYVGEVMNNLPHGPGVFTLPDGKTRLEGWFQNGRYRIDEPIFLPGGICYKGDTFLGKPDDKKGRGEWPAPIKGMVFIYKGEWESGEPAGCGKLEMIPQKDNTSPLYGGFKYVGPVNNKGLPHTNTKHPEGTLIRYKVDDSHTYLKNSDMAGQEDNAFTGAFENGEHQEFLLVVDAYGSVVGEFQGLRGNDGKTRPCLCFLGAPYGPGTFQYATGHGGNAIENVNFKYGLFYVKHGFAGMGMKSFNGIVLNGLPEGQGQALYLNGDKYKGGFHQGKKHGYGRLDFLNGRSYNGTFKNGQMHGCGVYTWKAGHTYRGELREGKFNGWGIIERPDGFMCESRFDNDRYHGIASIKFPGGTRYYGETRDNKPYGRGVYTNKKLVKFPEGDWYNGTLVLIEPDDKSLICQFSQRIMEFPIMVALLADDPEHDRYFCVDAKSLEGYIKNIPGEADDRFCLSDPFERRPVALVNNQEGRKMTWKERKAHIENQLKTKEEHLACLNNTPCNEAMIKKINGFFKKNGWKCSELNQYKSLDYFPAESKGLT